jgi:hypothetical protein
MCQGVILPLSAEYWQSGESYMELKDELRVGIAPMEWKRTQRRLWNVNPRMETGWNDFGMGRPTADPAAGICAGVK